MDTDGDAEFERLVEKVEPALRRALVAAYGPDRGREATVDALAWAWEHRSSLATKSNPVAYLYRVGQTQARHRRMRPVFERPTIEEPWVEPKLATALASLSVSQRVAVFLIHGESWTHSEVAELLNVRRATVQTHASRGMAKLRTAMKGSGV